MEWFHFCIENYSIALKAFAIWQAIKRNDIQKERHSISIKCFEICKIFFCEPQSKLRTVAFMEIMEMFFFLRWFKWCQQIVGKMPENKNCYFIPNSNRLCCWRLTHIHEPAKNKTNQFGIHKWYFLWVFFLSDQVGGGNQHIQFFTMRCILELMLTFHSTRLRKKAF